MVTWLNRRGSYLQCFTQFLLYDVPEWMLLEQTQVYEQIYVFLLSDLIFCVSFSQTQSMLTFDLNILKEMLS